jgi:hypothetical protein
MAGMRAGRSSDATGQASAEYVALLSVVALVLGAAATAGSAPRLGARVAGAVRHGVCAVAGGVCDTRAARAAGLRACPLRRRTSEERAGGSLALVRLERGDALALEERSDGTASVSFLDSGRGGLTTAAGVRLSPGVDAGLEGSVGVAFTAGRTWEFRSPAAARRFVARHAPGESLAGETRELARRLCPLCPARLRGRGRPPLPPPAATYHEGGAFGRLAADAGLRSVPRLDGEGEAEAAAVLGRRVGAARTTWYLRLDGRTLARLGGLMRGLRSTAGVLELDAERGRVVELRVTAAVAALDELRLLPGAAVSVASLLRRLRGETGGRAGRALEAELRLDLRDPANRAAALGLLSALAPGPAPPVPAPLAALARRLDAEAAIDVRLFDLESSTAGVSRSAALGLRLGADYRRLSQARRLLAAWSRPPGGGLRRREDCMHRFEV